MLNRVFNRTITYWAPSGLSGDGVMTFASPVQLTARWEDGIVVDITSESSREARSRAMILYGLPGDPTMVEGGYVYRGTSTAASPLGLEGAFEIKRTAQADTISGTFTVKGAYL